jgi:hypothetical protein
MNTTTNHLAAEPFQAVRSGPNDYLLDEAGCVRLVEQAQATVEAEQAELATAKAELRAVEAEYAQAADAEATANAELQTLLAERKTDRDEREAAILRHQPVAAPDVETVTRSERIKAATTANRILRDATAQWRAVKSQANDRVIACSSAVDDAVFRLRLAEAEQVAARVLPAAVAEVGVAVARASLGVHGGNDAMTIRALKRKLMREIAPLAPPELEREIGAPPARFAPAVSTAEPTIALRVRPGERFGLAGPGEIVEVSAREVATLTRRGDEDHPQLWGPCCTEEEWREHEEARAAKEARAEGGGPSRWLSALHDQMRDAYEHAEAAGKARREAEEREAKRVESEQRSRANLERTIELLAGHRAVDAAVKE